MQINRLSSQHAIKWYKLGWDLFILKPVLWIAMFFMVLLIATVLSVIPLGNLAFMFISPTLFAGIFAAMAAFEQKQEVSLGHMFSIIIDGNRRNRFLLLGGLNFLVNFVLALVFLSIIAGSMGLESIADGQIDPNSMVNQSNSWMIFLFLPILVIYLLAFMYAIPLMLFNQLEIKTALTLSLRAGLSNFLPILLAGIIYMLLAIFSTIIYGLGFVILIPVSFMVVYFSYKELFSTVKQGGPGGPGGTENGPENTDDSAKTEKSGRTTVEF